MFTFIIFAVFLFSSVLSTEVAALDIACERIYNNDPWMYVGQLKTCYLSMNLEIKDPGAVFSGERDDTIKALYFNNNKNISILPEKVDEKFPNLVFYAASILSIRKVSKIHFQNLVKLRRLNLNDNFITQVNSGTFDDLVALEYLHLGD
jgi:hypothetical protein